MFRLLVAGAMCAAAAGCVGEDVPDYRPLELNYLTTAIFEPTCGAAQCHSSFKQSANDVFHTPEGVRAPTVNRGLIRLDPPQYDPDAPADADLIHWITDTDPFLRGIGRMPFDAPM